MLTNPHDAFRGQTRSPEMVLFGMLSMVSYYCATVNLSVRHTVSEIFNFKNVVTLKNWVRDPSRPSDMSPFDRVHRTS